MQFKDTLDLWYGKSKIKVSPNLEHTICINFLYSIKINLSLMCDWIMWSVAIGMDPMNKIELAESLTHTLKEMGILNVNSSTVRYHIIYTISIVWYYHGPGCGRAVGWHTNYLWCIWNRINLLMRKPMA